MGMRRLAPVILMLSGLVPYDAISQTLEEKVELLSNLMARHCGLGQSITVSGDVSTAGTILGFKVPEFDAGASGTVKEIPTLLEKLVPNSAQADKTRDCMKPFMQQIFDAVLNDKNQMQLSKLLGNYVCQGACQAPGGGASVTMKNERLLFINEKNQPSPGSFDPVGAVVVADAWGRLPGKVSQDLQRIDWCNNTCWLRGNAAPPCRKC